MDTQINNTTITGKTPYNEFTKDLRAVLVAKLQKNPNTSLRTFSAERNLNPERVRGFVGYGRKKGSIPQSKLSKKRARRNGTNGNVTVTPKTIAPVQKTTSVVEFNFNGRSYALINWESISKLEVSGTKFSITYGV